MPKIDALALRGIGFYQRHLSHHKGFCCAHAALYGGQSCSAAVAQIVQQDGLVAGRKRIAQRFGDCRAAYAAIQGGAPLAIGTSGPRVQGLCCCGPIPIPFRCG